MNEKELKDCLAFAQEIATEAASIAAKYFGFDTEKTWKSDNTPLTKADTEINSLVIRKVQERYPDHSIYGEEESLMKESSRYIWVCDPIDGTMPYSLGLPMFTLSLSLVDQKDGQPILGLVNDPINKHMYWAYKGGGAFRNGKKITVNKEADLKNTFLIVDGAGHHNGFSKNDIIEELRTKGARSMVLFSFVYGAIQVANGKFTGAVFNQKYGHDVAAIKILTEEAGGKATDLLGNERRYDGEGLGLVASNGILHEEILSHIKRSGIVGR